MKTRNFIISFIVFITIGIILIVFDYDTPAYISFGFSSILGITFLTTKIMEKSKIKKLDQTYFVLTKEELLKEYNKLSKELNDGKLRQIILTYLEFKEEYSLSELKKFGLWLTKNYDVDPSGIDNGIVILFVNIHQIMMDELMKHIKEEIRKENIQVDFNYGYAIYNEKNDYEALKNEAIKQMNSKKK